MLKLSIVIPVYNSSAILHQLVAEIDEVLSSKKGMDYELILVDDNSPDGSREVISTLMNNHPKIKGVYLEKNVGQFQAILIGTSHAQGELIVHMDDDMEHPPAEIIKLLDVILENNQCLIVFGMSEDKYKLKGAKGFPKLRNNFINVLWGKYPTDSFRIFRLEMVFDGEIFLVESPMLEIYLKHFVDRKNVCYIEGYRNIRFKGSSGYQFYKKLKLFFKLTPYFLFKPKSGITFK